MSSKAMYRMLIRHSWVFLPFCLYISLFSLNPSHSMRSVETGCRPNFIVTIDQLVVRRTLYSTLQSMQNLVFDFLSGLPYLAHFLLPCLYSYWLLRMRSDVVSFLRFILAFGTVSFFGVLTQYMLPTPPPWMLIPGMKPTANFDRIDRALGFGLFNSIYSKSPLVCGAFPSLHTAWPTVILFTKPWVNKYFAWSHVGLMLFAATYSLHHWVIDVAFGFVFAYVSCRIANYSIPYISTERTIEKIPLEFSSFRIVSSSDSGNESDINNNDADDQDQDQDADSIFKLIP